MRGSERQVSVARGQMLHEWLQCAAGSQGSAQFACMQQETLSAGCPLMSSRPRWHSALLSPLRRPGWQPVARLVRVSHAPTAHALLRRSRDVCGAVLATAHPGLAGLGSGTSSGGLAMALGGNEGDRRASPHVAEVEGGRSSSAVAAALSLQASRGRSSQFDCARRLA